MDNQWTNVTDNPIVLDFSACGYRARMHEVIKQTFGFPGYYGKNPDALWDCMREFASDTDVRTEVRITGLDKLPEELHEYFQTDVMRVFSRVHDKYPHMDFVIKD